MGDWNKQAAPNNNMPGSQIKFAAKRREDQEFAEELSDAGERDALIKSMQELKKKKK